MDFPPLSAPDTPILDREDNSDLSQPRSLASVSSLASLSTAPTSIRRGPSPLDSAAAAYTLASFAYAPDSACPSVSQVADAVDQLFAPRPPPPSIRSEFGAPPPRLAEANVQLVSSAAKLASWICNNPRRRGGKGRMERVRRVGGRIERVVGRLFGRVH